MAWRSSLSIMLSIAAYMSTVAMCMQLNASGVNGHLGKVACFFYVQDHMDCSDLVKMMNEAVHFFTDIITQRISDFQVLAGNVELHGKPLLRIRLQDTSSLGRGWNIHLLAVFCHRTPGDLDALVVEYRY